MSKRTINEVLAENLKHYMAARDLRQKALGEKAGIGQTTVSLYLNPARRQPSKSGKVPSANLGDVERLATVLGVEAWELIRPLSGPEREAYDKIAKAFKALQGAKGAPKPSGGYQPKEVIEPHHPAHEESKEKQKVE